MIVTEHICPPVPTAQWDWLAYVEGEEDGATGRGATECEALRDLCEQLVTAGDDRCADAAELARLRARVLELQAVHEDASGEVLAERERWARNPLTRDQIAIVATYAPEGFTDGEIAEIVAKVELLHGIRA